MNLTDPLCLDNIKACCAASQLAYAQSTITDANSGESLLIKDCDDCTIIAFPGTHDLRDVLRDIDCLRIVTMILGQPCAVHAGFNRAHNALLEKIDLACSVREASALSSTVAVSPSPRGEGRGEGKGDNQTAVSHSGISANIRQPVFVTGHSKGAAVARRCALALLEKNFPITGLITFGEPRGGDARYAAICNRALANRTLRITNAADPVPWLPAWLAGNRHCGPEAWLPANAQYETCNTQLVLGPRLWFQLLLNSAEIFRAWQLKDLAPLADHHIDNYLRRLDAL